MDQIYNDCSIDLQEQENTHLALASSRSIRTKVSKRIYLVKGNNIHATLSPILAA